MKKRLLSIILATTLSFSSVLCYADEIEYQNKDSKQEIVSQITEEPEIIASDENFSGANFDNQETENPEEENSGIASGNQENTDIENDANNDENTECEHEFLYQYNGDETHTAVCQKCNYEEIIPCDYTYGESNKCICGNESIAKLVDVSLEETALPDIYSQFVKQSISKRFSVA